MVSFKIGAGRIGLGAGALIAAAGLATLPLQALTMRECSAAYKSAQASGTLGGMSWQQFRKARCGPGATPQSAAGNAAQPPTRPGLAPGGSAYLPGRAIFPSSVGPQYRDETPGKARMHTCLDQYRINKTGNGNAGLKWIQKGGGYYSECNKRLKGQKG
jgi:hypothetical protein